MTAFFHNEWYHKVIGDCAESFPKTTSADARTIAQSLLVTGCCIAQAIDDAFGPQDKFQSTRSAIEDLAAAVDRIAELLAENQERTCQS